MDLIERFKTGKIAVNCRTEKAAKEFLQKCEAEGLEWADGKPITRTNWKVYEHNTCYEKLNDYIYYANIPYYKDRDYEIIEYKEESKLKTLEMMQELVKNPELRAESESVQGKYKEMYYDPEKGFFYNTLTDYRITPDMRATDWQIIKPEPKEVDVKEATKALMKGKEVYCKLKCDGIEKITIYPHKPLLKIYPISTLEIAEGKWYIKED